MSSRPVHDHVTPPDVLVRVDNVSKYYPARLTPLRLLRYLSTLPLRERPDDFVALKGVSFHVCRGEVVGIVGPNGSGKSTMLQIIAGLLEPSGGHVQVKGRAATLLELGAGFNPEFTGRENAFVSGAVYGMKRRIMLSRFDAIAAFADIGAHIDQPVKTYSSGMYARLAFAVAIEVDPDIILVDEALAVGDVAFQAKCFRRIGQLRDRGTSILFVSHDMNAVQSLCDRAILLESGKMVTEGKPNDVATAYLEVMSRPRRDRAGGDAEPVVEVEGHRARITDCVLLDATGEATIYPRSGERCTLQYNVRFMDTVQTPLVSFQIKSMLGLVLFDINNSFVNVPLPPCHPGEELQVRVPFTVNLSPGQYRFGVGVVEMCDDRSQSLYGIELPSIEVVSHRSEFGIIHADAEMRVEHRPNDRPGHE